MESKGKRVKELIYSMAQVVANGCKDERMDQSPCGRSNSRCFEGMTRAYELEKGGSDQGTGSASKWRL
jgi:hypothetical protein